MASSPHQPGKTEVDAQLELSCEGRVFHVTGEGSRLRVQLGSWRDVPGTIRMVRSSEGLGLLISRAHAVANTLGLSIEVFVGKYRVASLGAGSRTGLTFLLLRLPAS